MVDGVEAHALFNVQMRSGLSRFNGDLTDAQVQEFSAVRRDELNFRCGWGLNSATVDEPILQNFSGM